MTKVTLHVRTEPYEEEDEDTVTFDGNKVIGEVKRGDEVLFTKTVITDDMIESVCGVQDMIGLEIETWAVQNTDYAVVVATRPAEEGLA